MNLRRADRGLEERQGSSEKIQFELLHYRQTALLPLESGWSSDERRQLGKATWTLPSSPPSLLVSASSVAGSFGLAGYLVTVVFAWPALHAQS